MMSRTRNVSDEESEPLESYPSLLNTCGSTVTGRPSFRSRSTDSWEDYVAPSRTSVVPSSTLKRDSGDYGSKPELSYSKYLLVFIRRNQALPITLSLGITGSLVSFAFTYWLSGQIFDCPPWTIHCAVNGSVHRIATHLGLVQGLLTSLYGISVASIVYATYKFAETTVWPLLTELPLTLEEMDYYIAHMRGSLASLPFVAWFTRKSKLFIIVLIVGILGILLQASSTVVGWVFTVVPDDTTLESNHTIGGGMGFAFSQYNPPGPMPGELASANALYSSWASSQSAEMLPNLREFLIDRTNLSSIGEFTVPALKAKKAIHCYGEKLNITSSPAATEFGSYKVGVDPDLGGATALVDAGEVLLRACPGVLSVWVDNISRLSNTRAVTKLMLAIVNGTIENGTNQFDSASQRNNCSAQYGYWPCSGISALACEVDIDLVESRACRGECRDTKSKALTSFGTTYFDGTEEFWQLSAYLGAVPSVLGQGTNGAQPLFSSGTNLSNSSYALPEIFSDDCLIGSEHWSLANVTNFINVTSGALGIYIAQAWPQGWTILETTLKTPRLKQQRAYLLLAPPGVALACLVLVTALSVLMYRSAKLGRMTGGWTSEIIICSADPEMRSLVDGIRAGYKKSELLEQKKLWLGQLSDGRPGL